VGGGRFGLCGSVGGGGPQAPGADQRLHTQSEGVRTANPELTGGRFWICVAVSEEAASRANLWAPDEHARFLQAIEAFGPEGTRSCTDGCRYLGT
jgi:hypothetical protein